MRFNLRRLLVVLTACAIVAGYFGYQRRLERLAYQKYDAPGPVAERAYWPEPVKNVVGRLESDFPDAKPRRVYRVFHERVFNYCNAFVQAELSPESFEQIADRWGLEPIPSNHWRVRHMHRTAPQGWFAADEQQTERFIGSKAERWSAYGTHYVMFYAPEDNTLNIHITNDY